MTFSSFHLSRDAEEREQLTHFYLALKKDTTIVIDMNVAFKYHDTIPENEN